MNYFWIDFCSLPVLVLIDVSLVFTLRTFVCIGYGPFFEKKIEGAIVKGWFLHDTIDQSDADQKHFDS